MCIRMYVCVCIFNICIYVSVGVWPCGCRPTCFMRRLFFKYEINFGITTATFLPCETKENNF